MSANAPHSPNPTHKLAELIERKRDCLARLLDLGARQLELVEQGEMTQLLKILSAKGHLIGLLQAIERELAPFRDDDPAARRWESPQAREQVSRNLAECEALLAEILRREKSSEGRMTIRRDEAAARLQGIHVAAAARHAYETMPADGRGLLDLTSDV